MTFQDFIDYPLAKMGLPAWFVGEPVLELNFAVKGVAKLSPSFYAPVSSSACWLRELLGVITCL